MSLLGAIAQVIGAVGSAVSETVGAVGGAEAGRIAAQGYAEEVATGRALIIGEIQAEERARAQEAEIRFAENEQIRQAETEVRVAAAQIDAELRAEERRIKAREEVAREEVARLERLARIEARRKEIPGWVWGLAGVVGIGLVFGGVAVAAKKMD